MKTLLVTGGAGFIGSCFVRQVVEAGNSRVVNLDALTYAGNLDSIPSQDHNHIFVEGSITDAGLLQRLFREYHIDAVVNFAAESHVDRSIDGPSAFIDTNIVGTYRLLDASLTHWNSLGSQKQKDFRFLHVSTDEVFGSLGETGYFTETTPYDPSSPYSASKAASDHLVRACLLYTSPSPRDRG